MVDINRKPNDCVYHVYDHNQIKLHGKSSVERFTTLPSNNVMENWKIGSKDIDQHMHEHIHMLVCTLCVCMEKRGGWERERERERERESVCVCVIKAHFWYRWFIVLKCCCSDGRLFFSEAGEDPAADAPCSGELLTPLAFDLHHWTSRHVDAPCEVCVRVCVCVCVCVKERIKNYLTHVFIKG